jgi:hypothetical protein
VRTRAGLGRVRTAQLVEQPVRRRGQPLLVLDDAALTHGGGGVVEWSKGDGRVRAAVELLRFAVVEFSLASMRRCAESLAWMMSQRLRLVGGARVEQTFTSTFPLKQPICCKANMIQTE